MNYKELQEKIIKQYRITINENSTCKKRMHIHPQKRMICKWQSKSSAVATFELLHEIGHCENNNSNMRRCEQEFYATKWALERCDELGIKVPQKTIDNYQRYIDMELERGLRRHGNNLPTKEDLKLKGSRRILL